MGDRQLQGLQQDVDEIGSLLVGTVQQVNERNEQVPDMLNRLDNLNAECATFRTIQEPKVSKRRRGSTGTSTRCKIILGTCVAVGLILLILICVLSVHARGAEDESAKASTELVPNMTQPGP